MLRLFVAWDVLKSYVTDGLILWRRWRATCRRCGRIHPRGGEWVE